MKIMVACPSPDRTRLELRDAAEPEIGPNDLLIAVRAAALNRVDLLPQPYRFGHSAADSGEAVGIEMAGEVEEMGEGVRGFRLGERVGAMAVGSFAQLVKVDYRLAMKLPQSLTWTQGAALPVTAITAHDALITNAALQPGESVFVRGAGSGVGVAALQIAKLRGARPIIGSTRSEEKRMKLLELGFEQVFSDHGAPIADTIRDATGGDGAAVILDHIGASALADNIVAAKLCGRIVSIGRLGGGRGEIDLDQLAYRRLKLIGVTFRSRSIDEHAVAVSRFVADMMPDVEAQRLTPVIDCVMPFAEADQALARMASNQHVGKIVLEM